MLTFRCLTPIRGSALDEAVDELGKLILPSVKKSGFARLVRSNGTKRGSGRRSRRRRGERRGLTLLCP